MRNALCKTLALTLLTASAFAASDKVQQALANLDSQDSATARQAEKTLNGQRGQALTLLTDMLLHVKQSGIARFRAARLLGDFGDKAAVADLSQALLSGNEKEATVRAEIVRSLVRLGSSNILIDYFKHGTENAPIVNAAIAIGLRGNLDEEAKKTLGALMANPDPRVAEAAISAVCWTYPSITKQDPHCPTSLGDAPSKSVPPKNNVHMMTPAPPPPSVSSGTEPPKPGDQAILDALKAKQTSNDPQLRDYAESLLRTLSEHYK